MARWEVVGRQRVHWMRHGQGIHNAYIDECEAAGRVARAKLDADVRRPELVDPVLTARGEEEACAAREATAALAPELLVVSPLRRATQTARLAFDRHWATTPKVHRGPRGMGARERKLYRVGPNCESWPNSLTENPY
jgi:broad specificity phosphatase PhoE